MNDFSINDHNKRTIEKAKADFLAAGEAYVVAMLAEFVGRPSSQRLRDDIMKKLMADPIMQAVFQLLPEMKDVQFYPAEPTTS